MRLKFCACAADESSRTIRGMMRFMRSALVTAGSGRVVEMPDPQYNSRPILRRSALQTIRPKSQPPATRPIDTAPRRAFECARSWNETSSRHPRKKHVGT